MNCEYHPERDATDTCVSCGKAVCTYCRTIADGQVYCPSCVDNVFTKRTQNISESYRKSAAATPASRLIREEEIDQELLALTKRKRRIVSMLGTITLISGILALVGLFLPWIRIPFFGTYSGWGLEKYGHSFEAAVIVLIGSFFMILFAFILVINATTGARLETLRELSIMSGLASMVAIITILTLFINAATNDIAQFLQYGIHVSFWLSLSGMGCAIKAWRTARE
jgi:hypothetical protein